MSVSDASQVVSLRSRERTIRVSDVRAEQQGVAENSTYACVLNEPVRDVLNGRVRLQSQRLHWCMIKRRDFVVRDEFLVEDELQGGAD